MPNNRKVTLKRGAPGRSPAVRRNRVVRAMSLVSPVLKEVEKTERKQLNIDSAIDRGIGRIFHQPGPADQWRSEPPIEAKKQVQAATAALKSPAATVIPTGLSGPANTKMVTLPLEVARRSMLPEMGAFRYTDAYSGQPTAVARPFSITSYNFAPYVASYPTNVVPLGATQVLLRRSVLQNLIRYEPNMSRINCSMDSRTWAGGAVADYQILFGPGDHRLNFAFCTRVLGASLQPLNTWNSVHTDGTFGALRAQYVPAHSGAVTWRVSRRSLITPATARWDIKLFRLVGRDWVQQNSYDWDSAVAFVNLTINAGEAGYYGLMISIPAADGLCDPQVFYWLDWTGDFFFIEPIPGFNDQLADMHAIRLNAMSLRISPTAPALSRGGQVIATQLPPDSNWLNDPSGAFLGELPTAQTFSFEKGVYGYVKPGSEGSFSLRNVVAYDPLNVIVDVQEELFVGCDTIAIRLSVPPTSFSASGEFPAANVNLVVVVAVERISTSVWLNSAMPQLTRTQMLWVLDYIRDAGQFYENPSHVESIKRFLLHGVDGVMKYGPILMKVLSALGTGASVIRPFLI